MNPSSILFRIFVAVVIVIIAIAILNAVIAAFATGLFSPAVVHLLDLLIVAIGVCYVIFGDRWFTTLP